MEQMTGRCSVSRMVRMREQMMAHCSGQKMAPTMGHYSAQKMEQTRERCLGWKTAPTEERYSVPTAEQTMEHCLALTT